MIKKYKWEQLYRIKGKKRWNISSVLYSSKENALGKTCIISPKYEYKARKKR